MQVHFDTYQQEADYVYTHKGVIHSVPQFTVEVTIRGDRRRVSCSSPYNGRVCIHGLAVRFSQGAKVWPGTATYWVESGRLDDVRPNIDKCGRFSLAGFFEDYADKQAASQHNAVA